MRLFLISCVLGIPIGIFYDIFRIIRIIIPHNNVFTAIEDLLFFVVYSVFIMCFTIGAAKAEFRIYYVLGNFIGFSVYFFTIGNIITDLFVKLTYFMKKKILYPIALAIKKAIYKKNY